MITVSKLDFERFTKDSFAKTCVLNSDVTLEDLQKETSHTGLRKKRNGKPNLLKRKKY